MDDSDLCKEGDCDRKKYAKNMCNKHYIKSWATPEFQSWRSMKKRCYLPNCSEYFRYGGRGIEVCERWLGKDGYKNFLADMGERPSPTHSLDRINNDGNYEPSNCRWATKREQVANRRKKPLSGHVGVVYSPERNCWQAYVMVNHKRKSKNAKTKEQAINLRKELEKIYE